MSSQRDEAARPTAGEDMADEPIIIERRDETLAEGDPVTSGAGYDPAAPDAAPDSSPFGDPAAPAGTGGVIPAAALSEQQWRAIQATFVDDPKGSVRRAAAAADEVMKAFVASLGREQAALRATWENDTTTEDLRTALQQYRAFCSRLTSSLP